MYWQKEDWPKPAADQVRRMGGEPIEAWTTQNHQTGITLQVLLSHDPSGEGGAIERHASVSASTNGVMRQPSPFEVADALNCVRIDPKECEFDLGSNFIHAFAPMVAVSS